MTEAQQDSGPAEIPEAISAREQRWLPSLIWLIPIIAALIGGALALKGILERGSTITISFKTAEGLEAGKTKIKYKNVDIGEVKRVTLSEDRASVIATAEMARQAEGILVDDTRFWVVRPRVAASGVTGLGTLLSGSYIGVEIGRSTKTLHEFVGLETPPSVIRDVPGKQYVLRGQDLGSLDVGSPIFLRRVQVGEIVSFDLDKDGNGVTLRIFVHAPYDHFVTADTRFWQASGIDLSVDATGLKLNTESLASIVLGGIAFQTPEESSALPPAEANTYFNLFPNRAKAMVPLDTSAANFVLNFKESLRGLSIGAPVDFRGVVIGEVTDIGVDLDPVVGSLAMPVRVRVYPERLLANRAGANPVKPMEPTALVDKLVARGLRAQLRTGNLLTGQLYVALDFFPRSRPAKIVWNKDPVELPTETGSLEGIQVTLAEIARKIEKIPFDAIGTDLQRAINTLDSTLKSTDHLVRRLDAELAPEVRAALTDARRTLGAAERTLSADAPLQQDMRDALHEVTRAAQALRVLADYLERHPEALIRGKKEGE